MQAYVACFACDLGERVLRVTRLSNRKQLTLARKETLLLWLTLRLVGNMLAGAGSKPYGTTALSHFISYEHPKPHYE